jgi:hypothetical protein
MRRVAGAALLACVLSGCALPAPLYYYCIVIRLNFKDGRSVDGLECIPREQRLPWKTAPTGPDVFSEVR